MKAVQIDLTRFFHVKIETCYRTAIQGNFDITTSIQSTLKPHHHLRYLRPITDYLIKHVSDNHSFIRDSIRLSVTVTILKVNRLIVFLEKLCYSVMVEMTLLTN